MHAANQVNMFKVSSVPSEIHQTTEEMLCCGKHLIVQSALYLFCAVKQK